MITHLREARENCLRDELECFTVRDLSSIFAIQMKLCKEISGHINKKTDSLLI